ncbi:uncharacterized protein LOC6537699 [Drosophila yakuba]|uniref:Ionotropic glutamate receptor C-terminal domain-containing protein n=1 Tax=Drosophila yakuba TaxID=7245 RepID=B4PLK7_DROYA|nr:uncharacterized protein LOC6537699 [Drosophila yakuba]EDW97956.1 uncharacterized protein Dyak_GE10272 [Drosophila yakuba]
MALPGQLKCFNVFLLLLLIYKPCEGMNQHEIFLSTLLQTVHSDRPVDTLFLLHQSNCFNGSLQDWNPSGIPTLRSNELTAFDLEQNFNHNALALVCLTRNSFRELLNTLAKTFDGLRQERIILMIHQKPDPSFIEDISHELKDLQFLHLIVLVVREKWNGTISASTLRLQPFPAPHFKQIGNIFEIKKIFYHSINFHGRVLNVIPSDIRVLFVALTELFVEFAHRHNSTLQIQNSTIKEEDNYDIDMNTHLHNSKSFSDHKHIAMDMNSNSLIILVPCGTELRGLDIFKELGLRTLTWLALVFYIIFVVVESTFVFVSNRFNRRNFSMRYTNPLVNLRAIRAILGQAFPISHRSSLSIKHFFVFMSLFGTLFVGFFDCKLRSFLTKKPYYSQIENFAELRQNGLTVVVDPHTRQFIEQEINADFFRVEVPNVKTATSRDLMNLVYSFDMKWAFVSHSIPWRAFKEEMKSLNLKILCESKNLTILENVPLTFSLRRNSIFSRHLRHFIIKSADTGMSTYWFKVAGKKMRKFIKTSLRGFEEQLSYQPLSFEHFKWLWTSLCIAYVISFMVFMMEILWAKYQRRTRSVSIV